MAKIIPLSEGSFTVDRSKSFLPFNSKTDELQQRNRGSLLVEVQPFLVVTGDDYLLLDTGLGFRTLEGNLQLYKDLLNHGIHPEEVTKVLMSHLHKDHTGGLSYQDKLTGKWQLSFPKASYFINKNELNYAFEHLGSSYHEEQLNVLKNSEQLVLTENKGKIQDNIHFQVSGGHSPYHQVYWIKDEDGIYFFGGDEAPQYAQLKQKFMAKYDYNGRRSMELRQHYLEEGRHEGWTFMFYHDINTPFIKL